MFVKDVDWNQESFYFGEDDSKMEEFGFKEEIQVDWYFLDVNVKDRLAKKINNNSWISVFNIWTSN